MRVAGCLNAHGIGGYNLLTQLLRPYPELRGFYFGVRSELYRLCEPKDSSTTSYIHLKEIQTKRDTNSLSIYYKPLKPALLIEGRYTADLRNGLLQPVLNPQKDGPNKLVGFFSKNEFCPAVLTFQTIADFLSNKKIPAGQFPLGCREGTMLALTIKNTPRSDSQVVTFELGTIENTQKVPLEFIIFNFKLP
jgi:hypothetical protein